MNICCRILKYLLFFFPTIEDMPSLDEAVRQANVELQNENKNLHLLVTGLHEKHHQMNLKVC